MRKLFSPPINDVTTDRKSPPRLDSGAPYPPQFWGIQNRLHPKVKPLIIQGSLLEVFENVKNLASLQAHWTDLNVDADEMRITGVAVTPVFKFKDDFSIEIREFSKGTVVVNMRSKSRIGKSDLGANAKRIMGFFDQLSARI